MTFRPSFYYITTLFFFFTITILLVKVLCGGQGQHPYWAMPKEHMDPMRIRGQPHCWATPEECMGPTSRYNSGKVGIT